jgi:hypothetical protein
MYSQATVSRFIILAVSSTHVIRGIENRTLGSMSRVTLTLFNVEVELNVK